MCMGWEGATVHLDMILLHLEHDYHGSEVIRPTPAQPIPSHTPPSPLDATRCPIWSCAGRLSWAQPPGSGARPTRAPPGSPLRRLSVQSMTCWMATAGSRGDACAEFQGEVCRQIRAVRGPDEAAPRASAAVTYPVSVAYAQGYDTARTRAVRLRPAPAVLPGAERAVEPAPAPAGSEGEGGPSAGHGHQHGRVAGGTCPQPPAAR